MEVSYASDGERIDGWLFLPDETKPAPGIVFCPGFTGTKYAAFYGPYVEFLVAAGYAVLLSDYRGWGDSGGPRGYLDPRMQCDDIRAGLTFLETREEIDSDRLGVVGVSFGGGNATYVNAVDARVRAGVAISAVGDGTEFLRGMRREYEWYEFLDRLEAERRRVVAGESPTLVHPNEELQVATPERRSTAVKGAVDPSKTPTATPLLCAQSILEYSPRRFAPETRAMLWVCVERDAVVPSSHSRDMFRAAPEPKRLVILPGRGHYSAYLDHFEDISIEMGSWLRTHLAPRRPVSVDR